MTNIYEQLANEDSQNLKKDTSENLVNDKESNIDQSNTNVYEQISAEDNRLADLAVKRSLQAVIRKDPAMIGEGLILARELGLDERFALDSDEAIRRMKERKREKDLENLQLAKNSPVLMRQLTDPKFAALAQDNVQNLAANENLWNGIISAPEDAYQGIRKGVLSREMGFIANRLRKGRVPLISTQDGFDLDYVPTEQDQKDFERLKEIEEEIANYDADGVGLIEGSGYFVGQYASSIPEAATAGLATWKTKTWLGAKVGTGIGFFIPDGPALIGGEAVGAMVGGTIGNFVGLFTGWNAFANKLTYDTFKIEGGHSWLELRANGYSLEDARLRSNAVGTVNAAIEKIGFNILAGPYGKALNSLKGSFARSGLASTPFVKRITRQFAKNALGKNGKQLTWNAITREFARDYGILLATETGQEFLQEAIAITANNLDADDGVVTLNAEEIGDRLWATVTETFKGMILFGLVGPGITLNSNRIKANKARNNTAVLEKIIANTKDDATYKRDQKQYQDYEQELGDKAGIKDFYFNANVFQQQLNENAITDEQLELFSPELAQQIKDARKEGSVGKVIKIPTGKYLAEIANTNLGNALFPHLKEGENEFSQTEMLQFYKDQPELVAAYKELFNQKTQDLKQFQRESRSVKAQIKKQLMNIGIEEDKARYMAAIPQMFAATYSKALGITPLEFLNRFQYNVVGEQDLNTFSKQFFNQNGTIKTDTQLFKNWFKKSVLVNSDGTPQILYHGTTDNFDHFDLDHPNRYDAGFAGTGVYLTLNEGLAKIYTMNKSIRVKGEKKIMKLYARLENPKIVDISIKPEIKSGGKVASDGFREQAIAEGHDGVIVKNAFGETVEVVIFEPNAVKSIDNNGNWSNEVNNLYQQQPLISFQQKGKQKQGKPIPQALFQISNLRESFDFAKGKTYATNRDFKLALQERVIKEAKKAKVDVKEFTAEVEKYLVQTVLEDAKFALEENANAVGWYNEKVSKAKALLSLIHPELATNPEANFAFTWALANTSNGIKVDKNFELAEQAYSYWEENGEFPIDIGIGDASDAINRNFKLFNRLIKEKGFESFEDFMKTTHTVKEVETYTNDEVSGETQGEIVYGAAVMGPKIGNGFFANLYGNYEQLTMDRWLMRTWGRMRGELVIDYTKQAKVKRGQLKELIKALSLQEKKELSEIIGVKIKLSNLDEVGVAIQKASTKKANRTKMNEIATVLEKPERKQFLFDLLGKPQKRYPHISIGGEIRKGGNTLAKYLDGQKEAPSGAPERRNIRKVFSQVLAELQQTEKDLTMADLQALLWYPERRLYDAAKLDSQETNSGYEDNEAPDYANAAESLARQQGVSDADIQTTLQEVDNELKRQATIGTRGSESGEGGTGGVRKVDTFQQQGNIDKATGLAINPDGTVTVYHHTDRKSAEQIRSSSELRSAGEPDVYVTTRAIADIGYGNTAVAIRVEPSRLSLDDEFPNGRKDFRLSVRKSGGSIKVKVGEYFEQQSSDGARGRFDPTTLTTILTQEADFSTFAHETAHYMLTVLENIVIEGNAPTELIDDFDALLKFWDVKDLETWKSFDINQKREFHESFAYNFEQYLFDTKEKPPSTDKKIIRLFRKFSNFIKDVYKEVSTKINDLYKRETGKDLPILTNEIRNVMDRMLATNEQIVQAEQIYNLKAMFQTQEQSGMNDAEWAQYTTALQEAEDETLEIMEQQSMKQVRWVRKKMPKIQKELDKKIAKIRKKVEAEVTVEIQQEPIYKLRNFLKRGVTLNDKGEIVKVKGTHKISIDSIKNLIPFYDEAAQKAEIKQLGTGGFGLVAKKGLDVKLVADMFNFSDPLTMIDALLETQKIEDAIEERTDQRMLEEHSDLVDPRQLELQVINAIHNEARARFVAVELNTLSKAMRPVRYQVAAATQVAQDILADKKLSEIRPSEFTRAETRALKEAEAAMKKGDTKAAIKAKRSQLLNNLLAKESIEIHKEYDKATNKNTGLFNKFFGTDKKLFTGQNKRNSELISAGRVILSSFGLGPKVEDINVFTENLRKYDEQLYSELEPMILSSQASQGQKYLTDLTYEEFQNIDDLMKSLWHQSRRVEQVKIAGKLLDLQPVVDTLVKRMDTMIQRSARLRTLETTPIGTTKAVPRTYLFNKNLLGFAAKLRRMESWVDTMDGASGLKKGLGSAVLELEGGKLGDFYNTLWFPMKSALDEYRAQQTIFTKQYSDMIANVDFGNAEITANEFALVSESSEAYTFGSESNGRGKVELLGAMLHTGNDSNLKKLLLGRGWGSLNEDGTLNRTYWDAFETRMKNEGILTGQDYKFLQAVWDLNEKMLPLLQRAHRDTEGYYFKTVKATPILNRFGEFRGGYVPAKGDPVMTDIEIKEEINILKSEFKNSLPKVESGMTKERNERFYQPLSLHLGYMTKHIDDTLRYAYVQPVLQDTLKILKNKEFEKKLKIIDPTIQKEMIEPWLKAAASQKTYAPSGFGQSFDRILATIKRRTGLGIMFANIGNAFQQLTGLFPALIKVKPRYLKDGLITYMKDREGTNQQIASMSKFMADRQKNLIFDIQDRINELVINPNKFQKLKSWGEHHGYFLQQTFQGITDSIVWIGTYNQVHETMSKDMSDEEIMIEAIKQADANVRLTQDSLLPEDRAAFQNMNPIVQSVTQFTGYFNMIANLGFGQYQKLVKDDLGFKNKGKNREQLVYMYLYTVVMPAVLAGIIMRGLGGRIEDEDEDGYLLDDMASAALGDIVNYTAGLVPIAGQVLLIPINAQNDIPWDDDIVSSPGIEALQDALQIIGQVPTIFKEGSMTGKQIRDVSTMVTLGSGMPVTPLGRILSYLRDVDRGYVKPKGPIDFVRGLVTGKAGASKK